VVLLVLGLGQVIGLGPAQAQEQAEGQVQELTGSVDQLAGGSLYVLPGLKAGQQLYVYAEGTSGSLDPVVGVLDPAFAIGELVGRFDADVERAIGEGSVSYLYSQDAVRRILKLAPEAKFIALVRNPLRMLLSYHLRMLFITVEDVEDFRRAWFLQEARLRGERIPRGCIEPLRTQLHGTVQEYRESNDPARFDESAFRSFLESVSPLKIDIEVAGARALSRVYSVLTPEQREQMHEFRGPAGRRGGGRQFGGGSTDS
jgi:hypothetical protein